MVSYRPAIWPNIRRTRSSDLSTGMERSENELRKYDGRGLAPGAVHYRSERRSVAASGLSRRKREADTAGGRAKTQFSRLRPEKGVGKHTANELKTLTEASKCLKTGTAAQAGK